MHGSAPVIIFDHRLCWTLSLTTDWSPPRYSAFYGTAPVIAFDHDWYREKLPGHNGEAGAADAHGGGPPGHGGLAPADAAAAAHEAAAVTPPPSASALSPAPPTPPSLAGVDDPIQARPGSVCEGRREPVGPNPSRSDNPVQLLRLKMTNRNSQVWRSLATRRYHKS